MNLVFKFVKIIEHTRSCVDDSDVFVLAELHDGLVLGMGASKTMFFLHQIEASVASILRVAFDEEVEFDGFE